MIPAVYIGGTGQHAGKTLIATGMVGALRERGLDARYIKPMGQRETDLCGEPVDDDAALLSRVYGWALPPKALSPVTMPSGFTERAITGQVTTEELTQRIQEAYGQVSAGADLVMVEGTGHAGVGSVVGLGNADVARLLQARAVLVTGGGVGRPIDDFSLNACAYHARDVPIAGVICNKIQPAKSDKVVPLLRRWFQAHQVPLLGCIPYDRALTLITLQQVAEGISADVLFGDDCLGMHVSQCVVGATTAHRMLEHLQAGVLAIIPGDREDLIMAAISARRATQRHAGQGVAICLTGDVQPHDYILKLVRDAGLPVLVSHLGTFRTASAIDDLVAKTMPADTEKIGLATRLVAQHVNLDELLPQVMR